MIEIERHIRSWLGEVSTEEPECLLVDTLKGHLMLEDLRSARQDVGGIRWLRSKGIGCIEWPTGVGKTRVALSIIKLLRRNDLSRQVIIVVPTLELKHQWEKGLLEQEMMHCTRVVVINSLIKQRWDCSLLILDEIHRYAADTFSRVFSCVGYRFILGLTATMSRLDGKHKMLKEKCPIIDTITLLEARKNRYISVYTEYNLGIEMSDKEREQYSSLRTQFQAMFDKFNSDFETLKNCSFGVKPLRRHDNGVLFEPEVVRVSRTYGWKGNTPEVAYQIMLANESRGRGEKVNVWGGNLTHPYHPDKMHGFAINGMRLMRGMKEFIYKLPSKIDAAVEVIEGLNLKTITFAELIETAETLAGRLGSRAVVYHSQIKAKVVNGKKIPGTVLKRQAVDSINATEDAVAICTAKALDQGSDFPGVSLGVALSRTSNPAQQTQRRGRVVRRHTFSNGKEKEAIFVNIYVKDTKDVQWLQKAQKNNVGIIWVDSVKELLEAELVAQPVN